MSAVYADLSIEQTLIDGLAARPDPCLVAGMDEVGRGALAGPVSVGVAAVNLQLAVGMPALRDSKVLSAARREKLVGEIASWAVGVAVGHASPAEIDRYGLSSALALAAHRGWAELIRSLDVAPAALILDGRDNWLTRAPEDESETPVAFPDQLHLQVKADARCASVSAAAITAKVDRDQRMTQLHTQHPEYGWDSNKGYGAAVHREALQRLGTTEHHRRSWNLIPQQHPEQGALL